MCRRAMARVGIRCAHAQCGRGSSSGRGYSFAGSVKTTLFFVTRGHMRHRPRGTACSACSRVFAVVRGKMKRGNMKSLWNQDTTKGRIPIQHPTADFSASYLSCRTCPGPLGCAGNCLTQAGSGLGNGTGKHPVHTCSHTCWRVGGDHCWLGVAIEVRSIVI